MQHSECLCSAVQCSAVQCSAVQYGGDVWQYGGEVTERTVQYEVHTVDLTVVRFMDPPIPNDH